MTTLSTPSHPQWLESILKNTRRKFESTSTRLPSACEALAAFQTVTSEDSMATEAARHDFVNGLLKEVIKLIASSNPKLSRLVLAVATLHAEEAGRCRTRLEYIRNPEAVGKDATRNTRYALPPKDARDLDIIKGTILSSVDRRDRDLRTAMKGNGDYSEQARLLAMENRDLNLASALWWISQSNNAHPEVFMKFMEHMEIAATQQELVIAYASIGKFFPAKIESEARTEFFRQVVNRLERLLLPKAQSLAA